MKKIDDSRLYAYFSLVMIVVAFILALTGLYSRIYVEKNVSTLLADEINIQSSYPAAYLILRNPQVFAGYEHFDADGISVRNTLAYFDAKLSRKEPFRSEEGAYLRLLLDRRQKGSSLTLGTSVFCLIVSFLALLFYFHEKKAVSRN